jgi:hypothetical protein
MDERGFGGILNKVAHTRIVSRQQVCINKDGFAASQDGQSQYESTS